MSLLNLFLFHGLGKVNINFSCTFDCQIIFAYFKTEPIITNLRAYGTRSFNATFINPYPEHLICQSALLYKVNVTNSNYIKKLSIKDPDIALPESWD